MKKKVAIVTNTSWNIINFRKNLVNSLKESFEVLLVAPKDEYSPEIEKLGKTIFLTKLSRKGTNPVTDLQLVRELKKIYKNNQVDLALHFTIKPNIYGSIAASQAKIPSIAVVTGLGYTFLSDGLAAKAAKQLYKQAFKRNTLTVFQNQDDRELFMNLGLVQGSKSCVINGSGIDVDEFTPVIPTDWTNTFDFLFIGRLLYDKGVRELLQAFTEKFSGNENVRLHIVGDIDNENPSAYSEAALNTVLKEHSNIIYHGRVNGVAELIANSNCVVLPSYREGVPRVMLEAISMAKPVIATNVAGCKETVIDGVNGFLVEAETHNQLAEKMFDMSQLSENVRKKMGEQGRQLAVSKFASVVINQEFENEIKKILGLS